MLKAFKYRIYPTPKQEVLISKHFNCCRFVYNLALEVKISAWESNRIKVSRFDLGGQLKGLKKDCTWLTEINAQSLYVSLLNLDNAYKNFFKGVSSRPKFKKKAATEKFSSPQYNRIVGCKLMMPKFRDGIAIVLHRAPIGEIKTVTVTKTATGRYFASVVCETCELIPKKPTINPTTTIGIDLGVLDFAVFSDGRRIENPRFLKKSMSKLKYTQRKYSKHKGKRTKKRLAIIHEKVANKRNDFLHKVSSMLIRENQSIAIEDLHIAGLVKNHSLAQSISDAAWGMFVDMLKYKAEWQGKNILQIGRFQPSSKLCNLCNTKVDNLPLSKREWTCDNCGAHLNRDYNAAINIKNIAIKNWSAGNRLKNQEELPALAGALTPEALTNGRSTR